MSKSKGVIKGALVLAISAFLSKFLGAVYRIPLTNVIKGEGLGLYQMVFPIYCILLDFAGAGVPTALSKIIAERVLRDKNGNLPKDYKFLCFHNEPQFVCVDVGRMSDHRRNIYDPAPLILYHRG